MISYFTGRSFFYFPCNFLKAVKTIRPDRPVILCTGFNPSIDERRAKEIGIDAFVNKPFLKIELGNTVRNILDRRRIRL